MFWAVPLFFLTAAAAPAAAPIFEAIRKDDVKTVQALLRNGTDPNSRDDLDATPLMHAALYASEPCMKLLLDKGADPNARAKGGSTALMWATEEESKVRLLLARGADKDIKNKEGLTALDIALRREGGQAAAKLLAGPEQDLRAIVLQGAPKDEQALYLGSPEVPAEIRAHGFEAVQFRQFGTDAMWFACLLGDGQMVGRILDAGANPSKPVQFVTLALPPAAVAAYAKNIDGVRRLLEKGAAVNGKGSYGHTALMLAVSADRPSREVVELLLRHGADANLTDNEGYTSLDWAMLQGESEISQLLRQSGAQPGAPKAAPPPRAQPLPVRDAITQAIALLQPIGPKFFAKTGCISCHNQSLEAMAVTAVRKKGIAVNEELALHPAKASIAVWAPRRENYQQGLGTAGGWIANVSYGLAALAGEGAPASALTDAIALSLARFQRPDGSWNITDVRPPMGLGRIRWTALVLRGSGAYMPPGRAAEWKRRADRAMAFLRKAEAQDTQDEAFRVLGLLWGGASPAEAARFAAPLLAGQKPDGGWSQLPAMKSDAYATGQALYALQAAGIPATHDACRKGAAFLLRTQLGDGSWYVRRRGFGFQPFFESGFPHGRDQFISAAATSWAVMALAGAL